MMRSAILPASLLGLACTISMTVAPTAVAQATSAKPPAIQPAADAILEAFQTHPLVALNDAHGLAQEMDFYAALIRDPRFARDVGNVVLEGGTALHQGIVDRYVNGDDVPFSELRHVWVDSVAYVGAATGIDNIRLYTQVRITNMSLPPEKRIRLLVGEPPSDWSKIQTNADFSAILRQRDTHAINVIVRDILDKKQKALVVYGGAHFTPAPDFSRKTPTPGAEALFRKYYADISGGSFDDSIVSPGVPVDVVRTQSLRLRPEFTRLGPIQSLTFFGGDANLSDTYIAKFQNGESQRITIQLDGAGKVLGLNRSSADREAPVNIRTGVEQKYPGVWYIVSPYNGFTTKNCNEAFDNALKGWPVPSLATGLKGSSFDSRSMAPGCRPNRWGDVAAQHDAVLYLGPAASLTEIENQQDPYLEGEYRKEIERRQKIKNLPAPPAFWYLQASPEPFDAPDPPLPSEAVRLAAFSANDADKDGKLDKVEFWQALKSMGFADQIDRLFLQRDVNRDYFVSVEEYRAPMR